MRQSITHAEGTLRRDRLIVLAGLVSISALAWAYLIYLTFEMGTMGMAMEIAASMQTWTTMDLWVATISLFVLVEKVVPRGDIVGRVAGGVLAIAGLVLLGHGFG